MSGTIFLVGFGPGDEKHMSFRAREAIIEADVVIGYSTYIKLVADLLDGKQVVKKGMTEEIDRCIEAHEHAQQGKKVALISSGDIGVYGMAGPTYEVLLQAGWTPSSDITVEVVPGSTALSACASLVGAPLTHDFCSISLSDLLTPWPTIVKRLDAVGASDFVVALYNPKSGRRTQQIVEAQRVLLQHRSPDTPVAVVKSAYRELQDIQMTTLAEMTECKIGMLTTVLIGNSSTFIQEGLMITPRGYANKYSDITGDAKDGEKKGRSLSMGLDGWKACLRQYLRDAETTPSLKAVSTHFDMPVGEVLSAIATSDAEDHAADFTASELHADIDTLLAGTALWGYVRAVVRSEAGAVSELLMHNPSFVRRNDWVNIETEHFHLHVDASRIKQAWALRRGDSLRGLHFTDAAGQSVFNISLVRKDGAFDPSAERAFEALWPITDTTTELEIA